MTEYPDRNLDHLLSLLEFKGRPIISMENGKSIGHVEDVLIDPDNLTLKAVVTERGGMFRPEMRAIPASEVQVWGEDVMLVRGSDVSRKKSEMTGIDNWVLASSTIQKRAIMTQNGERVGDLGDLLVTYDGKLGGFEVDRERPELTNLIGGSRATTRALPVACIHSLGKDALVLESDEVRRWGGTPAPVDVEHSTDSEDVTHSEGVTLPGMPRVVPVTRDEPLEGEYHPPLDDQSAGTRPTDPLFPGKDEDDRRQSIS